jgi:long-chain fatty acid transport protein
VNRSIHTPAFVLSLAGVALAAPASATNGYFSHGFGVRTQAAAGVAYALHQDAMATATNPSGLAGMGNRLDIGASLFRPSRGAEISGNMAGADGRYSADGTENFLIPEFGYSRVLGDELTFGLAIYGNGGMNTDYEINPLAAFGSTGSAGVNLEQLFVTPALGWQANDKHALGVGVTLAYQRFEMKGVSAFDNPMFSFVPGSVTDNGTSDSKGAGLKLGWTGQISETLTLGASWSSRIEMDRFKRYSGLFAERGGFDVPATYGAGAAWKPAAQWTLALDWQAIEYSKIKSVDNPLSNLLQGNPLGSRNGGGFGWQDIDVVKFGVVHQYSDKLQLRAGISRADQPIPASETFFNILAPGTVRDHISVGASWQVGNGEWSFSYTHARKEDVNGQGSIPMNFGAGEANIHLKENILTVGYSIRL